MKKLILLLLLIVLGAGGLYFHLASPETSQQAIVGPSSREIKFAARTHLEAFASNIDAKITTLVVGEQSQSDENAWNFRGALKVNTSTRTIFGAIQSICPNFQESECWQLSTLAIDGEFLVMETKSVTRMGVGANELSSMEEGETLSEQAAQGTEEAVTDKPNDVNLNSGDENNKEIAVTETWFSKTDNVNGRTGPATTFSIAFKIPSSVPLTLLKKQDKWGLFTYAAKGGSQGQIWVSMSLVEKR